MVTRNRFGSMADGREVSLFRLSAGGIDVGVTDLGACTVSILAPDAAGKLADVVPGFSDADGYLSNPSFFGATIGPSCNRIAGARIEIDGVEYHLPANEGANNLHTDFDRGLHKRLWETACDDSSVTMGTHLADGECGLPGERDFMARFELDDPETLRLTYRVTSDADTFVNVTDHLYMNLAGHAAGSILDQELQLFADAFTPVGPGSIPTGQISPVAGTPFDFTTSKPIGRDIAADDEQLALTGGFDHNFCVRDWESDGTLRPAARACDPTSGRVLELSTTQPGIQFYAGNYVGDVDAKDGVTYTPRSSFALETQLFPDTPHHDGFPKMPCGPGTDFLACTTYRFSTVAPRMM